MRHPYIDWRPLWNRASEHVRRTVRWFDSHSGTGSWVGAAGAVVAIFLTFTLARCEYMRIQEVENERVNRLISLIGRSASECDQVVQEYIRLVRSNDTTAKGYYSRTTNDIRLHHMYDFAHTPVAQWPSIETYDAFKTYWFLSVSLLQTSDDIKATDDEVRQRIGAYDGSLAKLQKTLSASRK